LVVGALLTATSTAETVTQGQTAAHSDDYAVDAGVEYGIEKITTDDEDWCPTTGSSSQQLINIDGSTVTVRCDTRSGFIDKFSDLALAALDPGPNSIQTSRGHSTPADVQGPTWIGGGESLQKDLEIDALNVGDKQGTLFEYHATCTGYIGPNISGSGAILGNSACTSLTPTGVPVLPAEPGSPTPYVAPVAGCQVLYPGHYTAPGTAIVPGVSLPLPANELNNSVNWYLLSGDYYFDNVGTLDLGNNVSKATTLVGGTPRPGESSVTPDAPCNTPAGDPVGWNTLNGYGVQIVLGGNSALNPDVGQMELFTRFSPGASSLVSPSLRTVPAASVPGAIRGTEPPCPSTLSWSSSTGGTACSNLPPTQCVLCSGSGNNVTVAVHGLIYVPGASVQLNATNGSYGEVLGGVTAWDVLLNASASASNFEIATSVSSVDRVSHITATAQYGAKTITASADVTKGTNTALRLGSWAISNP
jgi:hypothetical protein